MVKASKNICCEWRCLTKNQLCEPSLPTLWRNVNYTDCTFKRNYLHLCLYSADLHDKLTQTWYCHLTQMWHCHCQLPWVNIGSVCYPGVWRGYDRAGEHRWGELCRPQRDVICVSSSGLLYSHWAHLQLCVRYVIVYYPYFIFSVFSNVYKDFHLKKQAQSSQWKPLADWKSKTFQLCIPPLPDMSILFLDLFTLLTLTQ